MLITAIESFIDAQPSDGGDVIVIDLTDCGEQPIKLVLPVPTAERAVYLLQDALSRAAGMRGQRH